MPVRFSAAQERVSPAAHPELSQHLHGGLQDATGKVGAAGTFYSVGSQREHPTGVQRRHLGEVPAGRLHRAQRRRREGVHTERVQPADAQGPAPVDAGVDSPTIPALADAIPALGIENLQKMGAKFVLCANALGIWSLELEARGKGKAQDIEKELRANLLPGVTIVPAMVIAIEKAQEAGIKYNRQ